MMPPHNLTQAQINILRQTLAKFADKIDRVGLFGSRATGMARDNSDVDLVLYGNIDAKMADRLWSLFDDSNLSLKVDISAYNLIDYPLLKQHIDQVMVPLFEKHDLL